MMTTSGYIVVGILFILSVIAYKITKEKDLKAVCIAIMIFLFGIAGFSLNYII